MCHFPKISLKIFSFLSSHYNWQESSTMTWHIAFGARKAFLELSQSPHLLTIPTNISALVSISARTLRALIGFNGTDWPHLGPSLTLSSHGPGAPGCPGLGTQTLPGLRCSHACLQPCLWPHLLSGPWIHVVDPSPTSLTGWPWTSFIPWLCPELLMDPSTRTQLC